MAPSGYVYRKQGWSYLQELSDMDSMQWVRFEIVDNSLLNKIIEGLTFAQMIRFFHNCETRNSLYTSTIVVKNGPFSASFFFIFRLFNTVDSKFSI